MLSDPTQFLNLFLHYATLNPQVATARSITSATVPVKCNVYYC